MIPFKIDGKKYSLPDSWADVTVSQYRELKENAHTEDIVKTLSILTGVEYDTLYNTKRIDVMDKLLPFLVFLKEESFDNNKPKEVTVQGKRYPVADLGGYSWGQRIQAFKAMAKADKDKGDIYPVLSFVVAVYLYPIVTGNKYSTDEAEKFSKEVVDKMPITEAWPIGSFFLSSYLKWRSETELPYPLNLIKNKRLRGWVSSTYFRSLTKSMRLQGEIY